MKTLFAAAVLGSAGYWWQVRWLFGSSVLLATVAVCLIVGSRLVAEE